MRPAIISRVTGCQASKVPSSTSLMMLSAAQHISVELRVRLMSLNGLTAGGCKPVTATRYRNADIASR